MQWSKHGVTRSLHTPFIRLVTLLLGERSVTALETPILCSDIGLLHYKSYICGVDVQAGHNPLLSVASDVKTEIDVLTDKGPLDTRHQRWIVISQKINGNLVKARQSELEATIFIDMVHDDIDNISFLLEHHTNLYARHCAVHELVNQLIATCNSARLQAGSASGPHSVLNPIKSEEKMLKQFIENLKAKEKDMCLSLKDLEDPGTPTTKALGRSWKDAKDNEKLSKNEIAALRNELNDYHWILTVAIQANRIPSDIRIDETDEVQVLQDGRRVQNDGALAEEGYRKIWLHHRQNYECLKSKYNIAKPDANTEKPQIGILKAKF